MKLTVPENISAIKAYKPGKSEQELVREFDVNNPVKLASNENPWGPSPMVVRSLRNVLNNLNRYPDAPCTALRESLAEKFGLLPTEIVVGNGSSEIIELLIKALVKEGDQVVVSHPSFLLYQQFVQIRGGDARIVPLSNYQHDLQSILAEITDETRLIFLDNPNNPTGSVIPPPDLYTFLSEVPEHVVVVLDEAYIDYVNNEHIVDMFSLVRNLTGRCGVVFVRTFSKAYGIPSLRVGYGVMTEDIAQLLHLVRQPFNVNMLAQAGAIAALKDVAYYQNTLDLTQRGRTYLQEKVSEMGCYYTPSHTNFILVDVLGDANAVYESLLVMGIIVRPLGSYGFPSHIRVTVGTEEENSRFVNSLHRCINELGYV